MKLDINVPEGAVEVSTADLKKSGVQNPASLFKGDTLVFPKFKELRVWKNSYEAPDKKTYDFYKVGVTKNEVPVAISVGTFRRASKEAEWLKIHDDNRTVCELVNDEERMKFLAGKTLVVTGVDVLPSSDKDGKSLRLPIFKIE